MSAARRKAARGATRTPPPQAPIAASGGVSPVAVVEKIAPALPVLVAGLATMLALRRLDDWDTWWHLASGRWIAQHGSVPHTDTLSFTVPDHPWINLQWLYDVVLYGLYRVGGADLLVVTTALAFGLAAMLLIVNLRLTLGPVGAAAIALWVTAITQERFAIRPETVSFILLEIVLWLFATARRDDGRRLWLVPVVMLVWVNTHNLFIIGAYLIGCQMAAVVASRLPFLPAGWRRASAATPETAKRVLLSGLLALVLTAVNPYGIEGALFPFKLLSRINGSNPVFQSIGEFRPPFSGYFPTFATGAYQAFVVAGIAIAAVAGLLAAARRREVHAPRRAWHGRKPTPGAAIGAGAIAGAERAGGFNIAGLLLFAGLAYLSILARRNMALFAMGAAPFVSECTLAVISRLPRPGERIRRVATTAVTALMLPAVIAAAWFVANNGYYRWNRETHEFGLGVLDVNFPIRAAAFVKEMKLPPLLYNDETAGGYLAWERPVDGGVYVDGRLEVYDTAFFSSYMTAVVDPDRWQAEADRLGINTALLFHRWGNRHRLIRWLATGDQWRLVYFDDVAAVFVRQAGHAALIEQARARFAALNEAQIARLLEPVASWQWPVGQVQALTSFAAVLDVLGVEEVAAGIYSRLLEFALPAAAEAEVRLQLAYHYARNDDVDAARRHLARAAEADPHNRAVAQLRAQLKD